MFDAWIERWQMGSTGWHEPDGNRNLRDYWWGKGKRVLVPMCGKTPDLLWLEEQGNTVVGVELSEIAVREFFKENDLAFERSDDRLVGFHAKDRRITLFCGDYFQFQEGRFDAHYDRGALVAMPRDLRPRYAQHTSSLLSANAEQLVITVEYDQSVCDGPPFSIDANEVQRYWPRLHCVASVNDTQNAPPKFLQAGLEVMHESVWRTDHGRQ